MNRPIIQATITALSTRGEGIARIGGKAVFVPFTLPGEIWEVAIIEQKKHYDRALPILQIHRDEPPSGANSIQRSDPPCRYFGTCGGCQLQHIPYDDQLRLKRDWLDETFRRVGHLEVRSNPVIASPSWEYRNKMTFNVVSHDGKIVFAFHRIYQPGIWVPIDDCYIAHPDIRRCIPLLLDRLNEYKPRLSRANKNTISTSKVVFRIEKEAVQITFNDIQFAPQDFERISQHLKSLFSNIPTVEKTHPTRHRFNPRNIKQILGEWVDDNVDQIAFQQINDTVRTLLYDYVASIPYREFSRCLDGYCGAADLTCLLSRRFKKIIGVESNSNAITQAKTNVFQQNLSSRVQLFHQTLERFLEREKPGYDAFVLDPPRSGVSPVVRRHIQRLKPADLVMISCHPAALARDAASLISHGYRIRSIQPFDMFPQTYHLETVVHFQLDPDN